MAKYTRSEFLRLSGAGVAGMGLGIPSGTTQADGHRRRDETRPHPGQRPRPHHGRLPSAGRGLRRQERPLRRDRIERDVRNLASRETTIVDAEGMTVTPGFIDAHSHPASGGVRELVSVNLNLRSIGAIQDAIKKRASSTPPGRVDPGIQVRRHEGARGTPDHEEGARRGRAESSRFRLPPRGPRLLVQLQRVRESRSHGVRLPTRRAARSTRRTGSSRGRSRSARTISSAKSFLRDRPARSGERERSSSPSS